MTRRLVKKLVVIKKKRGGRDNKGRISVRHQGGEHKQYTRLIDWKRSKKDIAGKVTAIEYDPNRNADIALIFYPDGDKRYIVAPDGLKIGSEIIAGEKAPAKLGNCLILKNIPVGVAIHNLEIVPGKGAQMVRGAGNSALIQSKEEKRVKVSLPSGETRWFSSLCCATIGQVGNVNYLYKKFRKAGDKRRRGIRPTVRGVAQHPKSHPHGGGEGRSPIGMKSPKTPWGKRTLGKRTRKRKKYSDRLIIKRRK
ncbi:MAG: 50S ribosomal protein L2 [Patescibacteria group bacterium]|nr:50S ribosomal protein L2 [Patescibacteria group bacterium]